ncbi:MAG: Na+ dependent nucleoside transporter [Bacteroidetes bacterium]|nr:Na+ dependent nucleoside transporter [Bacteroidota bacterium]
MFIDIARGALGMVVLIGICFLLSKDRKNIDWKLVGGGILLQVVLAILILKVPFVYQVFDFIADGFVKLLSFTDEGARFVFGLWDSDVWVGKAIYNENGLAGTEMYSLGFMFAFKVLPTIVFFSAFSAMLYYFGILQRIIFVFAWVMSRVMHMTGAESIAAAANVFIGQTEAPLVIKPYLERMTKSEIMCLMTGGMATIAGGVFALFVIFLGPQYAIHFLTASIISAPAAIVAAKILYPETNREAINRDVSVPKDKLGRNVLDAISMGTTDGIKLAVNVGGMLIVFIAMVAFLNYGLIKIGFWVGLNDNIAAATGGRYDGLSLEFLLGMVFSPIAWLLGTPVQDITAVGQLLGTKTVINEVIAYKDLSLIADGLQPKSIIIATYALCGFANFSSIGIQIGGIGAIAPSQRETLSQLGLKSLIGGTIACFLTAIIAGVIVGNSPLM